MFQCFIVCLRYSISTLSVQGGIRAGVPTSYNEFKQLCFLWTYHSVGALVSCRRFDARCSMPPTSWEEMKMDFKSDRKSRIFHLLFDLTELFYTLCILIAEYLVCYMDTSVHVA